MAGPRPPAQINCPHDRDRALPRTKNIPAVLSIRAKHADSTSGKEANTILFYDFYPLLSTPNVVNAALAPTPGLRTVPGLRVLAVAQFKQCAFLAGQGATYSTATLQQAVRLRQLSQQITSCGIAVGRLPQATIATDTLWWYMSRPSASDNYRNIYPLVGIRPRRMNAQERHSWVVRLPRGPGHLEHIPPRVRRRGRAQAGHVARPQQVYTLECLE